MASNIFFGITINPTEEARNRTITMALMLALGAGAENVSSGGGGVVGDGVKGGWKGGKMEMG